MRPTPVTRGFAALCVGVLLSSAGCAASVEDRIRSVEDGLSESHGSPFWERWSLHERMAHHGVPGVGIAVVDGFELQWAKGYGVLKRGGPRPVTTETLFQTASIGKPVVAATALHFVDGGRLSLDRDVNEMLTSWRLPTNAFTEQTPVTLRQLLSHTGGMTVRGFTGYALGEPLPTLQQVLDGEPPANSAPVRVDTEPGTLYRYSGGGYLVVQQLLEDVTGEAFAPLVEETTFAPLRMTRSHFDPLPARFHENAARGHRAGGRPIEGGWYTYPEMGAGPFWSTPSDMARFVAELMRVYQGESSRVLSQAMAVEMFTPVVGEYGLGIFVGDDGGDRLYGLHWGANEGYQTLLVAYPKRGQAAIVMTNSDTGEALAREILNSLSREYGWVSGFRL